MRPGVRLLIGVTVVVAVLAAATLLPLAESAVRLVTWVRGAGLAGAAAFAVIYIAATVAMAPGSILTLGAGFAYGPVLGTLLVSPVSVLAATCAFLLGRTTARDWVAGRIAGQARFDAVDAAVGREGFKIVMLLRLSPLFPFTLLNYALGLTRVGLRDFVLASWLGMLPGTFLYVYLGSLLTSATEVAAGNAPASGLAGRVLYWGGLAASVLVAIVVTRVARKALDQSLEGAPAHEPRL